MTLLWILLVFLGFKASEVLKPAYLQGEGEEEEEEQEEEGRRRRRRRRRRPEDPFGFPSFISLCDFLLPLSAEMAALNPLSAEMAALKRRDGCS